VLVGAAADDGSSVLEGEFDVVGGLCEVVVGEVAATTEGGAGLVVAELALILYLQLAAPFELKQTQALTSSP
jgi:hypothetical protein